MSKPRGTYTDPVFDWAHDLRPLQDWLALVGVLTVFGAVVGWFFSILPVMLVSQLWTESTRASMSDENFGWTYLAAVALWVVPWGTFTGVIHLRVWLREHGWNGR